MEPIHDSRALLSTLLMLMTSSRIYFRGYLSAQLKTKQLLDTVTATDADGDAVTFTVSGSELAITSAGVLTFVSAPDYETEV